MSCSDLMSYTNITTSIGLKSLIDDEAPCDIINFNISIHIRAYKECNGPSIEQYMKIYIQKLGSNHIYIYMCMHECMLFPCRHPIRPTTRPYINIEPWFALVHAARSYGETRLPGCSSAKGFPTAGCKELQFETTPHWHDFLGGQI